MPRSRKVIRYNKKNQRKKLNRKNRKSKRSFKKNSFKKRSLKRKKTRRKIHRGGSDETTTNEGFFSNMTNIISNVFKKKKTDESNFSNNAEKDGLDEAEKMLIDYSNKKNMHQTIPHTELKIVYDNKV